MDTRIGAREVSSLTRMLSSEKSDIMLAIDILHAPGVTFKFSKMRAPLLKQALQRCMKHFPEPDIWTWHTWGGHGGMIYSSGRTMPDDDNSEENKSYRKKIIVLIDKINRYHNGQIHKPGKAPSGEKTYVKVNKHHDRHRF